MKVAIGSDHAGFEAKEALKRMLIEQGHDVEDLGTNSSASVDYPDFAQAVSHRVADGGAARGVLVCGTGIGMSITANKVPGIRAALCQDEYTARMSRLHNDANVLCLGSRVTGQGVLEAIVTTWLATDFEGGRHQRRVDKMMLSNIER